MAEFKVDGNYVRFQQSTVLVPKALMIEMRSALTGEMRRVKQQLLSNVSGSILKRRTGGLAKSITSRARIYEGRRVWARAGSKYYIGRFWEYGFTRRGKQFAPKNWATPVVNANIDRVKVLMEQVVANTYSKGGL